jgi:lipoprotein-anchoring transpeptidase ErfK/SrfK
VWVYEQRTGRLLRNDRLVAVGYSGKDAAKNDPAQQDKHGLGPIPQGVYIVGPEQETTESHGPVVLPLTPVAYTQTFGRSNFLIHGDAVNAPGSASHGCIILSRGVREEIASSVDRLLVVLSGEAPSGVA